MTQKFTGLFDPILHQPTRTQIVSFLCSREQASFSELKELTGVTDGNLDAHLKKLLAANYLIASKEKRLNRMVTLYALTKEGVIVFKSYIAILKVMIDHSHLK
ncbi:MAG: DNA-binding transcriptional ArsR family regulator [Candidatus Endobugula sp.]|jgi:DNA-binding transcriptional ArsR family regulator